MNIIREALGFVGPLWSSALLLGAVGMFCESAKPKGAKPRHGVLTLVLGAANLLMPFLLIGYGALATYRAGRLDLLFPAAGLAIGAVLGASAVGMVFGAGAPTVSRFFYAVAPVLLIAGFALSIYLYNSILS
jgi:hypothetical protein